MNIIIAGDGEVGSHLAKLLADENHNITVVDPHSKMLEMIGSHTDVLTIEGDSTSIEILEEAEVNKADLLIAVLHNENINLVTCILGKKLGAKKTIARISNNENLEEKNTSLFKDLGVDQMVFPERIAADEIVTLLKQTAATEIFDFSDGKLQLFLIKLEKYAYVVNKTLNQIAQEYPKLNFRAVSIHRNGKTIIPNGDTYFRENDLAYVITKPEGIEMLLQLGGKQPFKIKDIMIIGGGRVGKKAALSLENDMHIKLMEKDPIRAEQLTSVLNNTLIINGDTRDINNLEDEGIRDMDAVIALTNSSETNILTCLHARKLGVKRTIALIENIEYIDIAQNIGIDTIINKKLITASYINRHTMRANVTNVKCLSGINADAIELIAMHNSTVTKKPIRKLKMPEGAIIGGIVRGDESFIAIGDFQIKENDKVVVFSMPYALHKVNKLFLS
ncbi:MAG: Trk system potassium transporter TrkA [Bacteroidetes bacterium]|nr:MAG: Trk system potassium transporter TrkA [Bacteroidota bacterium]